MQIGHVGTRSLSHSWHDVALLGLELVGWKLVGGHASLKRLLWVGPGWKVLLLMQPLSHALKHVGLNLTHVLHVVLLLHALGLTRHRVKRTWLLRKRGDILAGGDALVGLHGLRRWGCEPTGCRNILASTAFRTEHAVGWNLSAAGIAVHDAPLPKSA